MIKEQFKTELKNNFDYKKIYLFYVIVNETKWGPVAVIPTGFEITLYHRYGLMQ